LGKLIGQRVEYLLDSMLNTYWTIHELFIGKHIKIY
jgi:hypothetical protein